ncbi:phosphotransferase [Pseudonocardia sp.]|uniref:phosphotransferase n=1 Tax=Pseudonocardia sp. TaxID=60912 RepID=UPI003D0FDED5
MIPDDDWLRALARRRGPLTVVGRAALTGGYASEGAERVDLSDGTSVVVKAAAAREVAALRAVAVVPTLAEPVLLAAGTGWVVVPFHDGPPLADDEPVPAAVLTMLDRVHTHWRGKRPRTVPVADAAWWRELCLQRIVPAVDPVTPSVAARIRAWADDPRALHAATAVPRTLTHGDPHRGNVRGGRLIDWGNARVAPRGFDLAVLRAQGTDVATGDPSEDGWSDLAMAVAYLGFAADHLGAARVQELAAVAEGGLAAL